MWRNFRAPLKRRIDLSTTASHKATVHFQNYLNAPYLVRQIGALVTFLVPKRVRKETNGEPAQPCLHKDREVAVTTEPQKLGQIFLLNHATIPLLRGNLKKQAQFHKCGKPLVHGLESARLGFHPSSSLSLRRRVGGLCVEPLGRVVVRCRAAPLREPLKKSARNNTWCGPLPLRKTLANEARPQMQEGWRDASHVPCRWGQDCCVPATKDHAAPPTWSIA